MRCGRQKEVAIKLIGRKLERESLMLINQNLLSRALARNERENLKDTKEFWSEVITIP